MWCWRRLLRVLWTARRLNQSILKEISADYSLEGWMLKLKLHLATWCEESTYWKRPWSWERLTSGGEGRDRGWDFCMASLTQWTWIWGNCEIVEGKRAWHAAIHGVARSQTQLSDWTTTFKLYSCQYLGIYDFCLKKNHSTFTGQGDDVLQKT